MAGTASAYDLERVQSNLASDYAECSAYFGIMREAYVRWGQGRPKSHNAGSELSTTDTAAAHVHLFAEDQRKAMQWNYSNSSGLIARYGTFCTQLLNDPSGRID